MNKFYYFKKLLTGKMITEKNEVVRYYNKIRNKRHIFIYSVCGRTASTAFQRILNSSNEICIYGEPHYIPDKILDLIDHMKKRNKIGKLNGEYRKLKECFKKNKHDRWYANAIKNFDYSIELIASIFSDIFKPIIDVDRFGFKEIRILSINTLKGLKELFPNSYILFLFRDPLKQWPSVKRSLARLYSYSLDGFLKEYKRISDIFLKFGGNNNNNFFIENTYLNNIEKVVKLLRFLKISKIDKSIVYLKIKSREGELGLNEKEKILTSDAYDNYLKLSELSKKFLEKL